MSIEILRQKIREKNNPTVVGLDPNLDFIPEYLKLKYYSKYGEGLKSAAKAVYAFNKGIIDNIADVVPAIKPQAAYYERLGANGVKTLKKTIEYAQKRGLYVITDGNRNDIGATSEAYADAHLSTINTGHDESTPFGADSLTVNGYLGTDGIKPFLNVCQNNQKSIFVLVKTSNPSSGELQDLKLENGLTVYEQMAELIKQWDESGKYIGAVVGATYPSQLTALRKRLPNTLFLIPGYGAQGGTAADIIGAFSNGIDNGIVNNSRGILTAYIKNGSHPSDFGRDAKVAAVKMKEDLLAVIK
ncbi:MAG: orotidine-5'-phosphate decarboxylase [Oscillospiraceae bacterium]|jgi:orotidine-5'-phosphate decarboxylase|nr:orotidine-5'-phosphate decarboxylase [Oscillospiraceae bacterium]